MQGRLRRLPSVLIGAGIVALGLVACGTSARPSPGTRTAATQATGAAASYRPPPAGVATVQLFPAMSAYTQYVVAKLTALRPQLNTLDGDIAEGQLAAAEHTWLSAHLTWLEIGQDDGAYGAFGSLGGAIDGLADGDVGGVHSAKFTGFHKVEYDLFTRHDLPAARTDAAELTRLVNSITSQTLAKDLALTDTSLDSWVLRTHEILEDALRDSLSQDDNYGSDSDLASIRADVSATREMLSVLSGLIEPRDPGLVQTAQRQLTAIDSALASIPAGREPGVLSLRTRQRLDGAVGAALETLAPVSELMQISNVNS